MNRRAILLACALLAVLAAASLVASTKIFDDRYIGSTKVENKYTKEIDKFRLALRDIKVEEGDKPEKILEKLLALPYCWERIESDVYWSLSNMADPKEECSPSMIDNILAMALFFNDDQDEHASFVKSFLANYGRAKFVKCSEGAIPIFYDDAYEQVEMNLSFFFEALLNVQSLASNDEETIEAIRSLDLRSDTLNFCNALNLAKQFRSNQGESSDMTTGTLRGKLSYLKIGSSKRSPSAFKIFSDFLTETCDGFKEGREYAISTVALAVTFTHACRTLKVPEALRHNRIQRVLEYSRVCLSFTRSDMREAIDRNIKKQLTKC